MRICHILEATGGGTAQVVLDLLSAGIEAGDKLTLIYSPLRAEPDFLAMLCAMKDKIVVQPLEMQRHVGMHDMRAMVKLYGLLKRLGPFDIIHSHSSKAGALTRLLWIFMPRTKQVYTPHAFMAMAPDAPWIYGRIEKVLSHFTKSIICVSGQEKRYAEQLGISKYRLTVVPNGVHLDYPAERETARKQLGAGKDFVVGFVGRLVPQKNPVRLIEAFAIAAAQSKNLKLVIVGSGELMELTEQAIKNHGLTDCTQFFTGSKGRDLIPGFDCLLCTSDYEAFGLVILEALAAGVPVISTTVGIAEDVIVPGHNGYIIKEFSAPALGSALSSLVNADIATRSAMSKAARNQAQHYSVGHMAEGNCAVYKKLLNIVS